MATRGRKAIEIDTAEFQAQLKQLEAAQPDGKFPNRSALWVSFESTEWAKSRNPRPLTAQVAMIKAKELKLEIQTPIGQKGRVKGQGPVVRGQRKSRNVPIDAVDAMTKATPEKYAPLIKKVANGSLKAVVKLNCLQCCNFQKKEVGLCTIVSCPAWGFRPYKHKASLTAEGRQRISLGLLDDKENDDEADSPGTVV